MNYFLLNYTLSEKKEKDKYIWGYNECYNLITMYNDIFTPFKIEIIRSDKNRFYWGGAKLGLDKYFKDIQKFDWIIVCNNDIEFNDDKFFQHLDFFFLS